MSTIAETTIRNGVDTAQLFATLDAIKAQPELGKFQFRAHNRWIHGAHNRTAIRNFYGAGQEDTSRADAFMVDAGEPAILLGSDTGPNPAEYLLHALAACLTTSLVYVAAARGVELTEVESTLEGDMDVQGALGLSDDYRNGFERIRVSFRVAGDAPEEKLREVVERAQQRSAVFDMVTNGVPVAVDVATA
ncbi:MAG TPA: OsmC family protein [Gaiellaceae bacterium]